MMNVLIVDYQLLIVFPRSMEDDELPSADGMGGRGSLPADQRHGCVLRL